MNVIKSLALCVALAAFATCTSRPDSKTPQTNTADTMQTDSVAAEADTATQGKVHELTKAEFLKKVVNYEASPNSWKYLGDKPAVVDFYATWCGPCKLVSPVLEELSAEYSGRVHFYKVDVDEQQELAAAFGISSIPTLIFIPSNGMPAIFPGAADKEELRHRVEIILNGNTEQFHNDKVTAS